MFFAEKNIITVIAIATERKITGLLPILVAMVSRKPKAGVFGFSTLLIFFSYVFFNFTYWGVSFSVFSSLILILFAFLSFILSNEVSRAGKTTNEASIVNNTPAPEISPNSFIPAFSDTIRAKNASEVVIAPTKIPFPALEKVVFMAFSILRPFALFSR